MTDHKDYGAQTVEIAELVEKLRTITPEQALALASKHHQTRREAPSFRAGRDRRILARSPLVLYVFPQYIQARASR
jgi:hypothetical protein